MPVISKSKENCLGQQFTRVIKVNADGQFTSNVAPIITATLGVGEVSGASKSEMQRKYAELIERCENAVTTTRKVIVYKYKAHAYIMRDERCVLRRDDLSFAEGLGICLAAAVFEEVTTNDLTSYNEIESSIPESALNCHLAYSTPCKHACNGHLIEWTEDREAFFAKICGAMEALALQMEALSDTSKVCELAEKGGLPMLASGTTTTNQSDA